MFAVAATLLVFSIPTPDPHASLGPALLAQWPSYAVHAATAVFYMVLPLLREGRAPESP